MYNEAKISKVARKDIKCGDVLDTEQYASKELREGVL